jgi:hypothetical protein
MSPFCLVPLLDGFAAGGCLFPVLGFFACGILLNDQVGPLVWPILAPFTAVLGAFGGIVIGAARDHPGRSGPNTSVCNTDEG